MPAYIKKNTRTGKRYWAQLLPKHPVVTHPTKTIEYTDEEIIEKVEEFQNAECSLQDVLDLIDSKDSGDSN